jgi:hypothetical protein
MSAARAYEEIVDLIAEGRGAQALADFQPSLETRDRIFDLVRREKTFGLDTDEASELSHYMTLEHILRLVKARARDLAADE